MTSASKGLLWALILLLIGSIGFTVAFGIRARNDAEKISMLETANEELSNKVFTLTADIKEFSMAVDDTENLNKIREAIAKLNDTIGRLEREPTLITEFVPVEKIVEKIIEKKIPKIKYKKCTVY